MSNLNEEIASMLSGSVAGQIKFEGGGGTSNYNELVNKPKINNVELSGNKTTDDLGLFDGDYNNLDNKPTIPPAPVIMVGATSETDGTSGYVPQPLTSDVDKFLSGSGEWVTAPTGQKTYSTTEQLTNDVWIDGKPIYQKTIVYTGAIGSSYTTIGNIPNVDTMISCEFSILDSNEYTLMDYLTLIRFYKTSGDLKLLRYNSAWDGTTYVTCKYTKNEV